MSTHLLSLAAGAYQNAVWVAAAAQVGRRGRGVHDRRLGYRVPRRRDRLEGMGDGDEVAFARIDLDYSEPFRQSVFNFAAHRRPEHYRLIVERVGRGEPLPVSRVRRLT